MLLCSLNETERSTSQHCGHCRDEQADACCVPGAPWNINTAQGTGLLLKLFESLGNKEQGDCELTLHLMEELSLPVIHLPPAPNRARACSPALGKFAPPPDMGKSYMVTALCHFVPLSLSLTTGKASTSMNLWPPESRK